MNCQEKRRGRATSPFGLDVSFGGERVLFVRRGRSLFEFGETGEKKGEDFVGGLLCAVVFSVRLRLFDEGRERLGMFDEFDDFTYNVLDLKNVERTTHRIYIIFRDDALDMCGVLGDN